MSVDQTAVPVDTKTNPEDIAFAQQLRDYHTDDPLTGKLWELEGKAHAAMFEGGKALALLNSAGAAAMLAFTQALLAKDGTQFRDCKPFLVIALVRFLAGALLASMVAVPIAHRIIGHALGQRSTGFGTASRYLLASILAFTAGAVGAVLAIALRL